MKKAGVLLAILLLVLCSALVFAQETQNKVVVYEFYGKGCPHCTNMNKWWEKTKPNYPDLVVMQFEVYKNKTNRQLFSDMSEAYGKKMGGVPTIFIGEKRMVGFSASLGRQIEKEIQSCLENGCVSPASFLEEEEEHITITANGVSPTEDPAQTKYKEQITLGAVISGAIVDAINPCAFAVLILLLTTILAAKKKKRVLFAGLAFTLAIFISYFLIGLGLYSAILATGIGAWFYIAVAALAVIIGLYNLKSYFFARNVCIACEPGKWQRKLNYVIKGVTSVPGAFLVGFIVSLFLLPCTSGPYIVILGLLAKTATRNYALMLLLLYNLIFVLPMLAITGAVYWGYTTTEKARKWRERKVKILHLIAGLILIALGIGMFIAVWLGYV